MQHHAGLSNGFWIYAVKAKIHTYNVTLIKQADYKSPKELCSGMKLNISHLRVFGCLAWVHILKKRRHKLQPKSQEMIFVGYELGSKGYQFWDAAHQHFKITCYVKFEETQFPAKEIKLKTDSLGLDLVNLAQPPNRPSSPRPTCIRTNCAIVPKCYTSKPTPCSPPGLHEALMHPYQTQELLCYSPQHLNICSNQQKLEKIDSNGPDLQLRTLTTCCYICSKKSLILIGKL